MDIKCLNRNPGSTIPSSLYSTFDQYLFLFRIIISVDLAIHSMTY